MARRKREPDQLRPASEILTQVMAGLGLSERLREREALTQWPDMVGETVAGRSDALRIREGVLYVRVRSAAWSQELHFLKPQILARYAERLGAGLVRDIRFTQH